MRKLKLLLFTTIMFCMTALLKGQSSSSSGYSPQDNNSVLASVYQTVNSGDGNLNNSTTPVAVNWNTTAQVDQIGVSNSGQVLTLPPGTYILSASMYYETAIVQRANVAFEFFVNNTTTGVRSASAYIRRASGHNEGSTSMTYIVNSATAFTLEVRSFRLGAAGAVNAPSGRSSLSITKILGS